MQAPTLIDKCLRASICAAGASKVKFDCLVANESKSVVYPERACIDIPEASSSPKAKSYTFNFENHVFIFRRVHEGVLRCEFYQEQAPQLARRGEASQKALKTFICTFVFDAPIPAFLTFEQNKQLQSEARFITLLEMLVATAECISFVQQHELLTTDALSKLQTRGAMRRQLAQYISQGNIALCMVHCSDFASINKKFGHDAGDKVIKEVADIIFDSTRDSDVLCRFGGALFGIGFQADSMQEALGFSQKFHVLLHERRYLDSSLELHFDIGLAHETQVELAANASDSVGRLIKHAEQALGSAQQSKESKIVCWDAEKFDIDEGQFQYFSGIFTPDNITNYRNMLLLWDISSIMADEYEFDKLFQQVVQRIASTLEFKFAGVINVADTLNFQQAYHVSELADLTLLDSTDVLQRDALLEMSKQVSIDNNVVESINNDELFVVIGLGNDTGKCFFMVGDIESLRLTHDTKMLLAGFVSQLGKALRRSILEEALSKQLAEQNAQLSSELETLKGGLQSSALVYRSQTMQRLMQQTQRAALTDTTVLITGESGTGKEKLIHALHSLGDRSKQNLVIVDCGSIPETLIEAELFGHVKGAFTGAGAASSGKVKEADGGILVFDEIGELPLTMQPKLLRFVQEKHFTPVGSSKQMSVDVKIIAVTNRDLAAEVEAGSFRKDLFYRLNVVSLKNPSLRERREDIPLLVKHFLTKFSHQFELETKMLTEQAMQAIERFQWPGNIRELENTLMQAVLLSNSAEICLSDLNLDSESVNTEHDQHVQYSVQSNSAQSNSAQSNSEQSNPAQALGLPSSATLNPVSADESRSHSLVRPIEASVRAPTRDDHWQSDSGQAFNESAIASWRQALQQHLTNLLDHIDRSASFFDVPLGKWLELELTDLVRRSVTDAKTGASRLFIPASTYRRKLLKLDAALQQHNSRESLEEWLNISRLLTQVATQEILLVKPLDEIQKLLTSILLQRYVGNLSRASILLGVSEPTFYKIKKQIEQAA